MRLAVISVVALLSACDPGGTYHVPGAKADGFYAVLAGPAQTSLRAHANWFTGSVSTVLEIKNEGATPLLIRPDKVQMFDCDGGALDLYYSSKQPRCSGRTDESEVTLAVGESCQLDVRFQVVPDKDRLQTLTLIHDGVRRDGVAAPISITFEMDRHDSSILSPITLFKRCVTPRRGRRS